MFAACWFSGQAHPRPAQGEGGRDEGEAQGRKAVCRRVGAGVAFILGRQPLPQQQYLEAREHFVVRTFSSFCGLGRVLYFFNPGCDYLSWPEVMKNRLLYLVRMLLALKCGLGVLVFWAL